MTDNTDTEESATPEAVLEAIASLPDEKVSAARVQQELDDSISHFADALQELILLGEVELCQRRGTGPRVWYKHRYSPGNEPPGGVAEFVWRCYVAKDEMTHHGERLFQTRDGAIRHLQMSPMVDPGDFEKVPYLDDVWRASTTGFEGREPMIAVVRKEPVYAQPMESNGEDEQSVAQTSLSNLGNDD